MPKEDEQGRKFVQRPYPGNTLQESLVLAQAIQDKNNGKPMKRILLADAIDKSPSSSDFRTLLSSSNKYGLTSGNEKSEMIELTDAGQSITHPKDQTEKMRALQEAAAKPDLFGKVYTKYKDGKLPVGDFFNAVLEREYQVPREHVDECSKYIVENGRFAGLIRDVQGSPYVIFGDFGPVQQPSGGAEGAGQPPQVPPGQQPQPPPVPVPQKPKQIFVAHGKNKKPLEQLKTILTQFKIPFQVAIDEPHKGRAISEKVADIMQNSSSGIFIFTADEKTTDVRGTEVWRPSDNVVFELGAGTVLYGKKIIIFREEGVDFGSDFTDYGHITFEKDKLDAKAFDLVRELIGLGFLALTPT